MHLANTPQRFLTPLGVAIMRSNMRLLVVAVGMTAAACAAGASAGGGGGGAGYSRNLISEAELAEVTEPDAYDIVRRLRPAWLQARGMGAEPVVYLDDIRLGGPDELRNVYLDQIKEIRFISASDATTRWGTDHTGGVIQVIQER
jgi:hypothetical protein